MRRKIFTSFVVVLLLASSAWASLAPLNPEFLHQKKANFKAASISSGKNATGYRPGPVNLSHLAENLPEISAAEDLPVSYDLRKLNRLTPIRDQGSWGTCWAFAATAAIESNYLTRALRGEVSGALGNHETLDLSELQLAWFIHNHPQKDFDNTGGSYQPREGTSLYSLSSGGFSALAIAFFSALEGPGLEVNLPYLSYQVISEDLGYSPDEWDYLLKNNILPSYGEFQFLSESRLERLLLPPENNYPETYGVTIRMTDALYATPSPQIGVKERTDIPESDSARHPNFDFVKRLIMEHGALTIAYHSESGKAQYINTEHHAFRYGASDEKFFNHEVAFVGWDDNFSRENFNENYRPSQNGAWLVRNSWGKNEPYFDGGYFWMSYEQPFEDGVAYIVEDIPENLGYYQHDPLGWCNAFGFDGSTSAWSANVFKITTAGEQIESIAFYTTDNNAVVEWAIYDLGTTRPTDAPFFADSIPSRRGSLTLPYAGYHTVKLDELLPISKGNYFSVVLKYTNPAYEHPAAIEMRVDGYSDFANVHDGESWFSADGIEWWDGTENTGYVGDDRKTLHHLPMNACIKAFTLDFDMSDNEASFNEVDPTPVTILGIELTSYPETFDAQRLNQLRDRPVESVTLTIPSSASLDKFISEDEKITFYLVNRNIEKEFTLAYSDSNVDGNFALGGLPGKEQLTFDPVFLPGYEPVEFWRESGFEFPVYGPFTATVQKDGQITLNVNELFYADGEKCAVPEGYYNFVYDAPGNKKGSISVRLRETDTEAEEEHTDPEAPNTDNTPETPATVSKNSSGCNVGLMSLTLLLCLITFSTGGKKS